MNDIEQQLKEAADLLNAHQERVEVASDGPWRKLYIKPPPPPTLTALAYALRDVIADIERHSCGLEETDGLDIIRRWLASREEGR